MKKKKREKKKKKKSLFRRIGRWSLYLLLILLLLFCLQVTVLAFPQIMLRNGARAGTVILYYDGPPDPDIDRLAVDTDQRLQASGFYDSTRSDRVFFFQDSDLYDFYVGLTLSKVTPQGFNLSVLGNSYVCAPIGAALAERTGGLPKYSIWEGSPAHIMAHEIGHQYLVDSIGRGGWLELSHWKQEGLPEYIANIGLIREDSAATLVHRFGVLKSDRAWSATRGWYRQGWDRMHYEAGLLVEFLFDVKGYTLEDIISDSVTQVNTRAELEVWVDAQSPGAQPR